MDQGWIKSGHIRGDVLGPFPGSGMATGERHGASKRLQMAINGPLVAILLAWRLRNGWSKSIVLENKVVINFDFRSRAKKSGHLDHHSFSKESPMCRALIPGILWELVILNWFC